MKKDFKANLHLQSRIVEHFIYLLPFVGCLRCNIKPESTEIIPIDIFVIR